MGEIDLKIIIILWILGFCVAGGLAIYGILFGICKVFKLKIVKKILVVCTLILEGFAIFGLITTYARRGLRARVRDPNYKPSQEFSKEKVDYDTMSRMMTFPPEFYAQENNLERKEILNQLQQEGLVEEEVHQLETKNSD